MCNWTREDEFIRVKSDWVTLIGEHWRTDRAERCEYWRVEKADSVIVLPVYRGQILCAAPFFRPGIERATLDFPGGRLNKGESPDQAALQILWRELNVADQYVTALTSLNASAWPVNSAFSNQGVWGIVAHLDDAFRPDTSRIGASAAMSSAGVHSLLTKMDCLQCRHVLLDYWFNDRHLYV